MERAIELGAGLLFVASAALWLAAAVRVSRGEPLLEERPRSIPPWGLFDLGIAMFAMLIAAGAAQTAGGGALDLPADKTNTLLTFALAQIAAAACTLAIVAVRNRASLAESGFPLRSAGRDLTVGVVGFLMLAPPALAIQAALTHFFPSQHPLAEAFEANPSPAMFWAAALAAVVAAPLAEEIFFRLILLGWLERMAALPHHVEAWLLGRTGAGAVEAAHPDGDPLDARRFGSSVDRSLQGQVRSTLGARAMPLVVSSAVFAVMHAAHGPDPIPLFLFAMGLGFLYQRTGSVVPCIVAHLLLNAFSMVVLWQQSFAAAN